MKLELSPQIFLNYSNIKFRENRSMVTEMFVVEGRTYRQLKGRYDETNCRFFQFCDTPKN